MDDAERELLWKRLERFSWDEGTPAVSFVDRLARDNAWNADFARRVANEYRRFLFLAVTAGHPVTPSDAVDQAWHLHLTYSRSYWDRLCAELLGQPLHHHPTRGGAQEARRFREQYERTLESYAAQFGESAPRDIWPGAEQRFSKQTRFARVDVARYWLVSRRVLTGIGVALLLAVAGIALVLRDQISLDRWLRPESVQRRLGEWLPTLTDWRTNPTQVESLLLGSTGVSAIVMVVILLWWILAVLTARNDRATASTTDRRVERPIPPSYQPAEWEVAAFMAKEETWLDATLARLAYRGHIVPIERARTLGEHFEVAEELDGVARDTSQEETLSERVVREHLSEALTLNLLAIPAVREVHQVLRHHTEARGLVATIQRVRFVQTAHIAATVAVSIGLVVAVGKGLAAVADALPKDGSSSIEGHLGWMALAALGLGIYVAVLTVRAAFAKWFPELRFPLIPPYVTLLGEQWFDERQRSSRWAPMGLAPYLPASQAEADPERIAELTDDGAASAALGGPAAATATREVATDSSPSPDDVAWAVALFGSRVCAGSGIPALAAVDRWRTHYDAESTASAATGGCGCG